MRGRLKPPQHGILADNRQPRSGSPEGCWYAELCLLDEPWGSYFARRRLVGLGTVSNFRRLSKRG